MRFALLLLLVAALLSGCATPAPAQAATEEPVATLVTSPDDASALAASGEGWHIHDYWGGEGRKTVVDETISTGGWTCNGCEAIQMRFRGATGMIVPMGTASLEITAEWAPQGEPRHGQPELWVKSARDAEPVLVATVEHGVAVVVNVSNEEADPPHQVLSRWEYWIMFPAIDQQVHYSGEVRVYGEAVRGLPIPPLPPHPDLWGGRSEIPLFGDDLGTMLQHEDVDEGSRTCIEGCLATHRPVDGVTVPHDAAEIVVTLTYGPGSPAGLGLRYHGGDTWERVPVEGVVAPPNQVVYRIPVTDLTGDSPYAAQSLWEFEVFLDQPLHLRAYAGGYSLDAVALKEAA